MDRLNLPTATDDADALSPAAKTQDRKTQDPRQQVKKEDLANAMDNYALSEWFFDFRSALAKDMQPLGDALMSAYQAGDFAAMQAALKKISKGMPELAGEAENLAEVLETQLLDAWLGDVTEEVENGDFQGHPYRGNQHGKERKDKTARDFFGVKLHSAMTPAENFDRCQTSVDWALRNKTSVQGIAWRKDLGQIDLPWGTPGDLRNDHKGGSGLSHVLSKHPRDVKAIAEVVAYGEIRPSAKADSSKKELWIGRRVAVLIKDKESSAWLLTSYSDD